MILRTFHDAHLRAKTAQKMREKAGFTLIELSIVLVIIGLIVGGVLVGQDLIRAAEVRATVSQIEKYNTSVNTFRIKFNAIPGDMSASTATAFGFVTRGGGAGHGDGNGLIEGDATLANALYQGIGETGLFWVDLSGSVGGNLIEGAFTVATDTGAVATAATNIPNYLPPAKLGRGNVITVWGGNGGASPPAAFAGNNWYGMSNVSAMAATGQVTSTGTIAVTQAYNIDKKMDDGFPLTGNVQAARITAGAITQAAAGAASATTCYDNGSTPNPYSISTNNGSGGNCALAFKFQ